MGPYVLHNKKYVSLKSHQNVLTIILDEAVVLITEAASKQTRSSALELRSLGDHPAEGGGDQDYGWKVWTVYFLWESERHASQRYGD